MCFTSQLSRMHHHPALFLFDKLGRYAIKPAQIAEGLVLWGILPGLDPVERASGNAQPLLHLLLRQSGIYSGRPQCDFQ